MTARAARRIPIRELAQRGNAAIGPLAESLLGKPISRSPSELRFYANGGLSVSLTEGKWYSFGNEEVNGKNFGDSLDLIQLVLRCGRGDASNHLLRFLGLGDDAPSWRPIPNDNRAKIAAAKDEAAKLKGAQYILARSIFPVPREGLDYLASRGIRPAFAEVEGSVAWDARAWGRGKARPALVVIARDAAGEARAVQRIFLDNGRKADLAVLQKTEGAHARPKMTRGPYTGSAVRLPERADVLRELRGVVVLAEGPETGASVWQACGCATWITLGDTNFGNQPVRRGQRVIIARDRASPNSPSDTALRKAALALTARGAVVSIASPRGCDGNAKADFNDVLQLHGEDDIRRSLREAVPFVVGRRTDTESGPVPFWPAPVMDRDAALALIPSTVRDFGTLELIRLAARDEADRLRAAAFAAAGLDPDADAGFPDEECKARQGKRAAISRRINDDVRAKHGVDHLERGRRIQLPAPAGSGKTRAVIFFLAATPAFWDRVVWIVEPDLAMAEQVARDLRELNPAMPVHVIRGRGAPRPDGATTRRGRAAADGKIKVRAMCDRSEVAERIARLGLPVRRTLCENAAGERCPFFDSCAYLQQESTAPGVYVLAKNYLFVSSPAAAPDLVIVDEAHLDKALSSVELTVDRLSADQEWKSGALGEAVEYREIAGKVRAALEADPKHILRELRARGLDTAEAFKPALRYLASIDDEEAPPVYPMMEDTAVMRALETYERKEIGRLRALYTRLAAEIVHSRAEANGVVFEPNASAELNGERVQLGKITVSYLKGLSIKSTVPALLIDASADLGINRRIWGARLEEVACQIERNTRVIQVARKIFSRRSLTGRRKDGTPISTELVEQATDLRADVVAFVNSLPGRALVVCGDPVEAFLEGEVGPGVSTAHFGALRGRNDFEGCDTVVVVGREEPSAEAVERMARAVFADDAEPLLLSGEYVDQCRVRRMRDGGLNVETVKVHPDQRVHSLLHLIREREIEQAIDRVRAIHGADPKSVYLLTSIVVDITVDETIRWGELREGGNRYVRAWRETGLLPTGKRDLHALNPLIWTSEKAADGWLSKYPLVPNRIIFGTGGYLICGYRKAGQRGRASRIYIDPTRHPDPRAAVEDLLGELADFRIEDAVGVAAATGDVGVVDNAGSAVELEPSRGIVSDRAAPGRPAGGDDTALAEVDLWPPQVTGWTVYSEYSEGSNSSGSCPRQEE